MKKIFRVFDIKAENDVEIPEKEEYLVQLDTEGMDYDKVGEVLSEYARVKTGEEIKSIRFVEVWEVEEFGNNIDAIIKTE